MEFCFLISTSPVNSKFFSRLLTFFHLCKSNTLTLLLSGCGWFEEKIFSLKYFSIQIFSDLLFQIYCVWLITNYWNVDEKAIKYVIWLRTLTHTKSTFIITERGRSVQNISETAWCFQESGKILKHTNVYSLCLFWGVGCYKGIYIAFSGINSKSLQINCPAIIIL